MTTFNPEIDFNHASINVSNEILLESTPVERRGYIMAATVLSSGLTLPHRLELLELTYDQLTNEDTARLHQPLLPDDLTGVIKKYREEKRKNYINEVTPIDLVLLAAAVDFGNRPVFDTVAHIEHHTSTHPRDFGLVAPDRRAR